jgi:hypothetical protein
MDKKLSLYEILGVSQTVDGASISRAFAQKIEALDRNEEAMDASVLASRKQMIRIAASTLLDPTTRLSYDAKLSQSHESPNPSGDSTPSNLTSEATNPLALSLSPLASNLRDSVNLRADSLALRAEALSLRADAMLLQAGAGSGNALGNDSERSSAFLSFISSGPLLRILTFLVIMCAVAFGLSRCAANSPIHANAAANQAAEKAALQEYFQTHGVRPNNMAELELLEAERRRKENAQRNENQDVDKAKSEEQKFEEESRRRGREVSEQLRLDEEQHKLRMQREQASEDRLRDQRKEAERMAEQQRIKQLEEQWKQTIKR